MHKFRRHPTRRDARAKDGHCCLILSLLMTNYNAFPRNGGTGVPALSNARAGISNCGHQGIIKVANHTLSARSRSRRRSGPLLYHVAGLWIVP